MYKHILIPIELEHNRDAGAAIALAKKLLDEGGQITALHVIEAIPGYVVANMPGDYLTTRRSEAMAALETEIAGASEIKAVVVVGHAGRTIQEFAQQHDSDCIVMASHQPGIQDYFIGSTAAWVVRHSKCSVHVIR
ncbi:universal stress protein [Granulosicoccus antarcticus]|uniref:Universal stress protein F n=1 Tax=Granulosicoccus antarcticus IMCC3135 TaxID=1192854 RepID=A0A2Z2NLY1_9GAMM|nr:universal stress protein [Granulosicoccus antarcticus]ASJ70981.1 Universal stress protein F [Granulosicoccus antarcticus IMCC3135]